ncbi:MAG: immune inhibitor A [Anaerolineales bacterium]|nr:immune inhibitor A [Anaerolineales bacterium]
MSRNTIIIIASVVVLGLAMCCICGLAFAIVGGSMANTFSQMDFGELSTFAPQEPTATLEIIRPSPTPEAVEQGTQAPTPEDPTEQSTPESPSTIDTLSSEIVPVNDPIDLAMRLQGIESIPKTLPPPPAPLQVGARDSFWVTNVDTNENFLIEANLEYVTDHLYFWIEDGLRFNSRDVADLSEAFENQIYPTNRAFFGEEWSPGVDGDPHIYVLLADNLGNSVAGYYSPPDEYHPLANEFSNAHEMFYLNYETVELDQEFTFGVLAHEFAHMIQWNYDPNEEAYIDEGFAEVANFLNGYDNGGFDWIYSLNPDMQLNNWPDPAIGDTTPHYGGSFLFLAYFLDRFGAEMTQALATHQDNGFDAVDIIMTEFDVRDPQTGEAYNTDDFFLDWALATFLNDGSVGDGRYVYNNYSQAPTTSSESIGCPLTPENGDVHQYGVDLLRISCSGEDTLQFEGSVQTTVLPADPHSGSYAFWSNKANQSDMTLTQTFDFRDQSGPLTLEFWTWYDIEEDYDLVYVVASTNGEDWEILVTPSGTADDPTGNSYGWGYTGQSGQGAEWIKESLDLSQFAGQEVQIRFEYVTDANVTGEGMLIDDIAIPELGYFEDFEDGEGDWIGNGFVRIENTLPQTYRLALVTFGEEVTIEHIELNEDNTAEITFDPDADETVLLVTGTTRYTRQRAPYRIWVP